MSNCRGDPTRFTHYHFGQDNIILYHQREYNRVARLRNRAGYSVQWRPALYITRSAPTSAPLRNKMTNGVDGSPLRQHLL